jgi:flagellar protein FlaG
MFVTSVGSGIATQNVPREVLTEGALRPHAENRQPEPEEQKSQKTQILTSATADLERISLVFNRKLQFVVDHASNKVTVKVIDKETDKVIRVIPPEELQRLHNDVKETIGFLFDERV